MEHSEDMVERRFRHTVRVLQGIYDGRWSVKDKNGECHFLDEFARQVANSAHHCKSGAPVKVHVAAHVCDMPGCSADTVAQDLLDELWTIIRQADEATKNSACGNANIAAYELQKVYYSLKSLMPLLLSAFALTGAIPWPYEKSVRAATFISDMEMFDVMDGFRGRLMEEYVPLELRYVWGMPLPKTYREVQNDRKAN